MQPVFLCGHRKSGTTMLLNLLDQNEQLITYPEDLCLLYGFYPHHIEALKTTAERKERFNAVVFEMLKKKVKSRGYNHLFDVDEFHSIFDKNIEGDDYYNVESLMNTLFKSYYEYLGESTQKTSLWKETSIEIYAKELGEMFPQSKFIQLVRDPRDNYAAIKSGVAGYYSKLGDSELTSLASVLHRVEIGFKLAELNKQVLGEDRYKVVRFEDILQEPEKTMKGVCEFLGIEYTSKMLIPSSFGVQQGGNSHEGKVFNTISADNLGRWKERINKKEAQVIEFFLGAEMQGLGYDLEFDRIETLDAVNEYYKWSNYQYFYKDSFGTK